MQQMQHNYLIFSAFLILLDSPDTRSEHDSHKEESENESNLGHVRDSLIRKYSYKQAMCIDSFCNTVKILFVISLFMK